VAEANAAAMLRNKTVVVVKAGVWNMADLLNERATPW
jgi:hypothetical protein